MIVSMSDLRLAWTNLFPRPSLVGARWWIYEGTRLCIGPGWILGRDCPPWWA